MSKPLSVAPPPGGGDVAGQHAQRRGFACAVGAQKTDDLALADLEGDVVHGQYVSVGLAKLRNRYHLFLREESQAADPSRQCRRLQNLGTNL